MGRIKWAVICHEVAGVAGFEPTNAGIKIRCLNHLATPQYGKEKINGAGDENRTHDLQGHNLAL